MRFSARSVTSRRQYAAKEVRRELSIADGTPVVGFVGRLVEEKGLSDLLMAAETVRERFPGVVFLIVGLLGFISNPIVGEMGYFHANVAHNLVHIVLGLILLLGSKTPMMAAKWLKIVGVLYLVVALLGFIMMPGMGMNVNLLGFVSINGADNWLHVVVALVTLIIGFGVKDE